VRSASHTVPAIALPLGRIGTRWSTEAPPLDHASQTAGRGCKSSGQTELFNRIEVVTHSEYLNDTQKVHNGLAADSTTCGKGFKGTSTLRCWSVCRSTRGAEVVRSYSSRRRALEPALPRLPCDGRECSRR